MKVYSILARATVRAALILWVLLGAGSLASAQERFAVVIGVSEYPSLPAKLQLRGPKNDAQLVRDFLLSNPTAPFKAENIITLADNIEGSILPTLGAIRTAMKQTAQKVQQGDFVYLHFSGHGSQTPAPEGSPEIDGLDEIFLPRDIGKWDFTIGTIKNALVDNEIGDMIDAIRAKGAFVWAVFDACYSGTATRGAPVDDSIRMRKIGPDDLGIPAEMMDRAEEAAIRSRGGPPARESGLNLELGQGGQPGDQKGGQRGGMVAFSAAQSIETTPELRLPVGKKGRKTQGLFTFTLFQAMAENPGLSYHELAQEVLRRYGAAFVTTPTPYFEGDLDRTAFGAEKTVKTAQWLVKLDDQGGLSIPAGQLHGLEEGTELILLPTISTPDEEAIGKIKVETANTLSSDLVPATMEGKPPLADDAFEQGLVARLVDRPVDFLLTVARPDLAGISSAGLKQKVQQILKEISETEDSGLRLNVVEPGMDADLRLAVSGENDGKTAGHLWLLSTTGQLTKSGASKTPSISLLDKSSDEAVIALQDNLARIARVVNLLKLGSGNRQDEGLDLVLRTKRKGEKKLDDLDPASVPRLFPGDQIHLLVKNTSTQPFDINVLYIGSDYSISHMKKARVNPGDTLKKGLIGINDKSFGTERVLVITTPAKPQSLIEDLSFLAQKAVPATRGNAGFKSLLREAGFGQATRGGISLGDDDEQNSGVIRQFLVEIAPG